MYYTWYHTTRVSELLARYTWYQVYCISRQCAQTHKNLYFEVHSRQAWFSTAWFFLTMRCGSVRLCRTAPHDSKKIRIRTESHRSTLTHKKKRGKALGSVQNENSKTQKQNLKPTNRLHRVFGEIRDGVQTRDTRDKRKLKSKTKTSQRSRWSTSTDAPSSCDTGGAKP